MQPVKFADSSSRNRASLISARTLHDVSCPVNEEEEVELEGGGDDEKEGWKEGSKGTIKLPNA